MKEKIIEIDKLSFAYDKEEFLLKDIDMEIFRGDFIALLGHNGSGKSTLIKLILKQLKATEGTIKYLKNQDEKMRIGYIAQMTHESPITFPITAFEVVSLNLYDKKKFYKLPSNQDRKKVMYALEMVELEDKWDTNFNYLSGGEKQRVLIAKALINNPDLLILDEPSSGIDKKSKEMLFDLLNHLNKYHQKTILIITHEYHLIKDYSHKVFEIVDGQLKERGVINGNLPI